MFLRLRRVLEFLTQPRPGADITRRSRRIILHPAVPLVPSILKAVTIVRPERLVRWHRAGFRLLTPTADQPIKVCT